MVTASVDLVMTAQFGLHVDDERYRIKTTLTLESLDASLVASQVGPIQPSDLTQDIRQLLSELLPKLNDAIPDVQMPPIPGMHIGDQEFIIADRELVLSANFVPAGQQPSHGTPNNIPNWLLGLLACVTIILLGVA